MFSGKTKLSGFPSGIIFSRAIQLLFSKLRMLLLEKNPTLLKVSQLQLFFPLFQQNIYVYLDLSYKSLNCIIYGKH